VKQSPCAKSKPGEIDPSMQIRGKMFTSDSAGSKGASAALQRLCYATNALLRIFQKQWRIPSRVFMFFKSKRTSAQTLIRELFIARLTHLFAASTTYLDKLADFRIGTLFVQHFLHGSISLRFKTTENLYPQIQKIILHHCQGALRFCW